MFLLLCLWYLLCSAAFSAGTRLIDCSANGQFLAREEFPAVCLHLSAGCKPCLYVHYLATQLSQMHPCQIIRINNERRQLLLRVWLTSLRLICWFVLRKLVAISLHPTVVSVEFFTTKNFHFYSAQNALSQSVFVDLCQMPWEPDTSNWGQDEWESRYIVPKVCLSWFRWFVDCCAGSWEDQVWFKSELSCITTAPLGVWCCCFRCSSSGVFSLLPGAYVALGMPEACCMSSVFSVVSSQNSTKNRSNHMICSFSFL